MQIHIDGETAEKLTYIQQQTDCGCAQILQIAVADYYNKLTSQTLHKLSEPLRKEDLEPSLDDWSDFIGSVEAESDLAENYKTYLTNELNHKYDNR